MLTMPRSLYRTKRIKAKPMANKQHVLLARRQIQEDKRFKRFKHNFEQADYFNLNIQELEDELTFLHNNRPVRTLKDLKQSAGYTQHILNAVLTDQAYRSRFTEMMVACVNAEKRLQDGLQALIDYLQIEYATELSCWRTKDERRAFLTSVLRPCYKYLDQVNALHVKLELVITDIDKAGFALKNSIQALELVTKPERHI